GFPDKTTLEDINGKLNWQVLPSNALTGFYLRGDKRKQGRSAAITRPPETTVDQKGPTALYKIEDNHVVSSNLVLDAFYSYLDEGFQLVAEGGDKQTFQDSSGVWHNSFISQYFKRPQHQVLGSVNYFFNTGSLGHEIKGGGSWRNTGISSQGIWGGGGLIAFAANSPRDQPARLPRGRRPPSGLRRHHAAVQRPHRGDLLERLRQRHHHGGPADDHRRPAVRRPEFDRSGDLGSRKPALWKHPSGGKRP